MASRQSLNSSFSSDLNENGSICALEGAIPIFLKVLLFHLSGHGNHHDDATLNPISDSSSCILGLSNAVSFVSGFFLEGGQNIRLKEQIFSLFLHHCTMVCEVRLRSQNKFDGFENFISTGK